jgi:hypothetical protein
LGFQFQLAIREEERSVFQEDIDGLGGRHDYRKRTTTLEVPFPEEF